MKAQNTGEIIRYKTELMGIAAIGVLITHSVGWIPWPGKLHHMITYGGVGVYIFAFLSGIGCYYSLSRDHNPFRFYKRRAKRLLIPYALIAVFGYFFLDVLINRDLIAAIKHFTFFSYFTNQGGCPWYICFCIVAYAIAPALFHLRNNKVLKICILALTMAIYVFTYVRFNSLFFSYDNTMMALFIFSLGIFYAPAIVNCTSAHLLKIAGVILVLFFLKVLSPEKNDFLDLLGYSHLGIALACLGAYFLGICKWEIIHKTLRFWGNISLEIYLVNHFVQLSVGSLWGSSFGGYIFICVLGTGISILVHRICNKRAINTGTHVRSNGKVY